MSGITDKIIAKLTAATIIIGSGALIVMSQVHDLPLDNGIKEISLLLIGGAIAFLWKE